MLNFSLNQSCALITGASCGLGAEFARQLAPHASVLILVARRKDRLENIANRLQANYPQLHIYVKVCDLSILSERQALITWIEEQQFPLNLVINNAGLGDLGSFFDASWQRLQEILDLNITALTHTTHLLLPLLRKQAPSAIVQVGSIAGFFPQPSHAIYAASKAYTNSFSRALHLEEKKHGVTVTLLAPGPVPTEFFEVASRSQAPVLVNSRAPACLITSPEKVVSVALQAVLKKRACVIPNKLLNAIMCALRFLPFCLFQYLYLKNKKDEIDMSF